MNNVDHLSQLRLDLAKLGMRLRAGEVRASRVLEQNPESIHGCSVFRFLTYIPASAGEARYTTREFKLIRKARIPGHVRLGDLNDEQRERLARVLQEYETKQHPAERGLA